MRRTALVLSSIALVFVLCAGQAPAQSGGIAYAFYGRLHVSAEYMADGNDGGFYLSSNASRFGVRGESRLEDQIKAIWQIETTVDVDESGTEFATRNSFVGVESPYGRLVAGRHDSPMKILGRKADLFKDSIGDSRNIIGSGTAGFDLRLDNVVMYSTPVYKDFSLHGAYALGDGDNEMGVLSTSVMLDDEALGLLTGLAVERHGKMLTPVDKDGDGVAEAASENNETAVRAAVVYDWRDFILTGVYEMIFNVNGGDDDSASWGLGLAYEYRKQTFKGQFYGTDGTGAADSGSSMYALGYELELGKTTRAYAAYAAGSNDAAAITGISGGAHGDTLLPAAGADPYGVALGLIHDF